jgi:hypothetical protein
MEEQMVSLLNILGVKGFAMLMVLSMGVASTGFMDLKDFVTAAPTETQSGSKDLDTSKLTVEQIKIKAAAIKSQWGGKLSSVQSMMTAATKKKNIMRINCLDPKIKSAKFWISEGRSAYGEVNSTGSVKSKERMALLFQKITVIDSNVEQQVMLASRCIGDEKFSSGEGFELKVHQPGTSFNPDDPTINFDNFMELQIADSPDNLDWSVELTWPTASPYR